MMRFGNADERVAAIARLVRRQEREDARDMEAGRESRASEPENAIHPLKTFGRKNAVRTRAKMPPVQELRLPWRCVDTASVATG